MAEIPAEALAALEEEHPVIAVDGCSRAFAAAVSHVAAIVETLKVLPDKRERVAPAAAEILGAYVNGCWQVRRESGVRTAEGELGELAAVLEAVQAALAALSEETRQRLERDLAMKLRDRQGNLLTRPGGRAFGLDRVADDLDVLAGVVRHWAAPPEDGDQKEGHPVDHDADFIATAALEVYEDLTGLEVNKGFKSNHASGEFVAFLQRLYDLFGIAAGAEYRARAALDLKKP